MTEKEKLEAKIKLTESNIELIKQIRDSNKKSDRIMIAAVALAFFALLFANIENKQLVFMSVFGISLFTTSTYIMFDKMTLEKRENSIKLRNLEFDLEYYKFTLNKMNEGQCEDN